MSTVVESYIESRKQGMAHEKAAAHIRQRFGVSREDLDAALLERRDEHLDEMRFLPPTPLAEAVTRVLEIRYQWPTRDSVSPDNPCIGCGSTVVRHYCSGISKQWRIIKELLDWKDRA